MSAFFLEIVIRASVFLALALVADLGLRRWGSASVRHFLWAVTMTALLALPVAALALPAWAVDIPVAPSSPAVMVAMTGASSAIDAPALTLPRSGSVAAAAVPVEPQRHFDPLAFAFALYSAGVVLLLVRLVGEQLALVRVARRSQAVDAAEWLVLVKTAARQMGLRRRVRLLAADEDVMPFTFGTREPTIVIPAAAAAWSDARRRTVIVHELAHVARADCLAQRFAAVACALYWPHPGVWWGARRLRIEREHACDDRVLSLGTAAREYADHLLEIAHAFRGTPAPATALGMARARQLENRLLALLDTARNRMDLPRRGRMLAIAVSAALLVPVATLRAQIVHRAAASAPMASLHSVAVGTATAVQRRDRGADRFTQADFSGTWELRPAREAGMVQVNLRTAHSSYGRVLPLSRFEGINEAGTTAAIRDGRIVDGTVHFASRRDAGTFTFDGVCRNQMCGGTYSFAPDATFAARLAKYGVGAPTASEQYELAMADVGVDYLEGLKAEGYPVPDVETLVRAAEHGVSLEYVKGMASLGYKLGGVDALIRMRDHGVDPEYVKGMAAYGFKDFTADEVVRLRDHGVDPTYVKGMREAGFGSLGIDDLVAARDHGVDPTFVADMAAAGYRGLSMEDLLHARDHGADPRFASGLASLGYRNIPLDGLIKLRDHGVDPTYVGGLSGLGYKNLSLDTLTRLRDHGIDPNYVASLAALGYKDLPIESLVRLRDHGVDAAYVRSLQQRGIDHLSVDELIRRRDNGEDDPRAMGRAALTAFRSYYHSLLASIGG